MKELKLELLKETVAAYTVDTRSIIPDMGCVYEDERGHNCAIGRIMTPEAISCLKKNDMNSGTTFVRALDILRLKGILPLKEKWMPLVGELKFLDDIQSLHDRNSLWDESGLNDVGKRTVEAMTQNILKENL